MKTKFIRIDDVSEIDTSKIGIFDMANRYIDKYGNMYGLRYNRDVKKIEVVKIMRTQKKHATYFSQKIQMRPEKPEAPHNDDYLGEEMEFDPEACINHIVELSKTHKNRLSGIIMNIANSNIIADTDKMLWNTMNDLFRNIDMDAIQQLEKIADLYNEFNNYPRSIIYYQSKLDTKHRKILDEIPAESSKFRYVKYYEMWYITKTTYKTIIKLLNDIRFLLEQQHIEDKRYLTPFQKQTCSDALTSIDNTITEANTILADCGMVEELINTSKAFIG
ncbi:MAG TPA: hypothetical protein PLU42_05480 [Spirochaetota bacterium]|nr:hypothetical protein [Spirochaetota bacterium]